jgi:hypothetical protein
MDILIRKGRKLKGSHINPKGLSIYTIDHSDSKRYSIASLVIEEKIIYSNWLRQACSISKEKQNQVAMHESRRYLFIYNSFCQRLL